MKNNKIWFRRKLYGWGWTPSTWEGWLVLVVWLVVFISLVNKFDHEWMKNMLLVFLSVGVLLYICYKKGEKPKWQWGKRLDN